MVVLRHRAARAIAATVVAALVASSCGSTSNAADEPQSPTTSRASDADQREVRFPGDEWQRTEPEAAGFDDDLLTGLASQAEDAKTECLVVIRDGRVAGEWYWLGSDASTSREVFSVTKSIVSALIGMLEADGALSVDDLVALYAPEWVGTASQRVTIRNLLSNDSGRARPSATDLWDLAEQSDRTSFSIALDQAVPPGSEWTYNNAAIQVLSRVIERAAGEEAADYARRRLFEPIGMLDTELGRDRSGGTTTPFGATTTCLDLARFGLLFEQRGRWEGEQIVPEQWVKDSTTPSTDLNRAYGWLWWLNRSGRITSSALARAMGIDETVATGQLVPSAPATMFWALGLGDQILQVDPGSGTVVARIGVPKPDGEGTRFTETDSARFVTEALTS